MLAFVSYVIATIIFFLVGHGDKPAVDTVWGLFFVALGLALSYVPGIYGTYRSRL